MQQGCKDSFRVAEKFMLANCYNPKVLGKILSQMTGDVLQNPTHHRDRPSSTPVPGIGKPEPARVREK